MTNYQTINHSPRIVRTFVAAGTQVRYKEEVSRLTLHFIFLIIGMLLTDVVVTGIHAMFVRYSFLRIVYVWRDLSEGFGIVCGSNFFHTIVPKS